MAKFLKRIVLTVVVLLVLALGAVLWIGWAPDLDPSTLRQRYANDASEFVTLAPGTTAHIRDQGKRDAPPVLMLHGSNASLHTWEPWVKRLGDGYRLISMDLPGHGLTGRTAADDYSYTGMARFVLQVMDKLGVDQAVIAGSSMGGAVAMQTSLLAPERVKALVLVDAGGVTPPDLREEADPPLAFKLAASPAGRAVISVLTPRSMIREGLEKSFTDDSIVTSRMVDLYYDLVRYPGNRYATAKRFENYVEGDTDIAAERIDQPTLILWGADDLLIPVAAARHLEQLIDGAELHIYQNVGHLPQEEKPDASADDVRGFLSDLGRW